MYCTVYINSLIRVGIWAVYAKKLFSIYLCKHTHLNIFSCVLSCLWMCLTTTSAWASMLTSPWSSMSPEVGEIYCNVFCFYISSCINYLYSIKSSSSPLMHRMHREGWAEWNKSFKRTHSGHAHMHKCVRFSQSYSTSLLFCMFNVFWLCLSRGQPRKV